MTEYNTQEISQETNIQSSREVIQSISANRKRVLEKIERLTKKIGGVDPIILRRDQKGDEFTFTQTPIAPASKRSENIYEYFPSPLKYTPRLMTCPGIEKSRENPIIQIQEVIPKRIVKNIPSIYQQTQAFFSPKQYKVSKSNKLNKVSSSSILGRTLSPNTRIPLIDPVSQVLQSIRSTLIKSKANTENNYQMGRDIYALQKKIKKINNMLTSGTLY